MIRTTTIRRRAGAAVLAAALASTLATTARAEDRVTPHSVGEWYGWQTLLSDGSAVGLWVLAVVLDDAKYTTSGWSQTDQTLSNLALAMGFAAYGLGAPAIHLAHVQTEKAWSSFALRLGLPVAGALAGGLIANAGCSSHSDRRSRAPSSAASSAPRRAASSRWWSTRRCSRASRQEVRRRRACSRSSSPPPGAGPSCLRDGSELFAGAISALAWILL